MPMTLPETRHSLFIRLQDAADDDAWREFTRIYEPAVYRFGRKKGLQHADAAELAQDVLTRVIQVVPKWDQGRSRGSFRSWLFTVARTRVVDAWRAASRSAARLGEPSPPDLLTDLADRNKDSELDSELRRQVIRVAAERIRPEFQTSTWEAFWRTSIEGGPIVQVAADLKMTLGAVYAARSRVLSRLRDCVQRLWAECEQEVPS
jgi:RNA polymerase sigma factor (sigma-70 family)